MQLLPVVVYVACVSWLDLRYHLEQYHFPPVIVTMLGTVIGLILAFRTNSSYGRWWEARILWGAVVNDSRTWTRQLLEFSIGTNDQGRLDEAVRRMSLRQAAWCFALARSLRGEDPIQDLVGLIENEELDSYRSDHNVPNAILLRQATESRALAEKSLVKTYQFVELERTLTRLTDSMGGCERIKNTPFPQTYSRMVNGMIYVFAIFLPFSLVDVPWGGLVCTALTLSCGFLLIERVAIYLQDPFSSRPSGTPMLALSTTVEINIKQMIGAKDLPSKMKPVDGVLY